MHRRENKRVKYLYMAMVCALLNHPVIAQSDVVSLSRIKDFINAGLTRIVLASDSVKKDTAAWKEVDSALQKNSLQNPVYYAAIKKLLEGKFDSVTKKFSAKVDSIDVSKYKTLDTEKARQALYDTAFFILQKQYPLVVPSAGKDSLFSLLMTNGEPQLPLVVDTVKTDTAQKPLVNSKTEATYTPWYARFQGFVFWLLACILISIALFLYCLDQVRQLKHKVEDAEKQITSLQESEHIAAAQGPVTTVYSEFRNLITLRIKELYDIVDHQNLRIVALERERLFPTPKLEEPANIEGQPEHIFYMSVPAEGYFPFSSRSLKKDALYKFVLSHSNTEAQYEMINDGLSINEALQDLPKYILSACTTENEPHGDVRLIVTKQPGIALYDGEKWSIQQKAVIVFI